MDDATTLATLNRTVRPLIDTHEETAQIVDAGRVEADSAMEILCAHTVFLAMGTSEKYAGKEVCISPMIPRRQHERKETAPAVVLVFEAETHNGDVLYGVGFSYDALRGWMPVGIRRTGARVAIPR